EHHRPGALLVPVDLIDSPLSLGSRRLEGVDIRRPRIENSTLVHEPGGETHGQNDHSNRTDREEPPPHTLCRRVLVRSQPLDEAENPRLLHLAGLWILLHEHSPFLICVSSVCLPPSYPDQEGICSRPFLRSRKGPVEFPRQGLQIRVRISASAPADA